MSPSRVIDTLASGLSAGPLFYGVLAGLHLHLNREVTLERAVEIQELRFSKF